MDKMKTLQFYKLQASGNDFVLIQASGRKPQASGLNYRRLAKKYCQRKFGIGADGLLVIEPSKEALFKMRIFNPDGSEAEMCGNGARCVALWAAQYFKKRKDIRFDTKAGIIEAKVPLLKAKSKDIRNADVKIKMSIVSQVHLELPIKIFERKIRVNYINTGVPHSVILVEGLDKIDVNKIGEKIRFHKAFKPEGANVDFVEIINDNFIKIRTYERGVEAETLACGTGVVASAIIASYPVSSSNNGAGKLPRELFEQQGGQDTSFRFKIKVLTKSGDILKVYFRKDKDNIEDVWLEGKAYIVYKGEIALSS